MLNLSLSLRRVWITPGPHKGWRPETYESVGKAMQIARTAKRFTLAKLARATNILTKSLWLIEKGQIAALPAQRAQIERYVGVPLLKQVRSRIDRAI